MLRALVFVGGAVCSLSLATGVMAQTDADSVQSALVGQGETLAIGIADAQGGSQVRLLFPKEPLLAAYLSTTLPGLGQIYAGNWQRGAAFMGGMSASLLAVYVAGRRISADLVDYDGWNPVIGEVVVADIDGQISHDEYEAWRRGKLNRKRFEALSGSEKFIAVGGSAVAIGLYIWNIYDAYHQARNYNLKLYQEVTGLNIGMMFTPRGTPVAQISIPF